jgi:hypothetical protein
MTSRRKSDGVSRKASETTDEALHVEAGGLQVMRDQAGNVFLIFDDEDERARHTCSARIASRFVSSHGKVHRWLYRLVNRPDTILVWFPFECILEMLQECFQFVNE